jgi:hypothetical protein
MQIAAPSLADLQGRQHALAERQAASVGRVAALAERHRALGSSLTEGISELEGCSQRLAETTEPVGGLSRLWRPFTTRRTALARKSASAALRAQYEQVATRLREALAFTDELALAAADLQAEVERLHREHADAGATRAAAQARLDAAEGELARLGPDDALRRDQLAFAVRGERAAIGRIDLAERLAAEHLGPARTLRDTALSLHEHMAGYVTSASRVVDRAGGRVAVVGLLADAPGVLADLHATVRDLEAALAAAEQFVSESQRLLTQTLPELTTDAVLLASAQAEVEAALGGG